MLLVHLNGATLAQRWKLITDLYENWAIKSGEFDGVLNNNFIQFRLKQTELTMILAL
jgi:hypothetical protein